MQELSKETTLQSGKYRIIRVLGQGGFGITYLATDYSTGKYVAIKEFFPKGYCSRDNETGFVTLNPKIEKYKRKFISEANKIAQLNHKGVIKVICVFEENGTAYYVMQYIAGQSLYEILKHRKFTLEESLQIIGKVSNALSHIHSKMILHLDIKPMNIMMRTSDNEPIIIDFGISKTYDVKGNENTTFFLPAASPGYSPAEQFAGEVNSFAPQLDVYSLGATLYTLLTGNISPYPTPTTTQKLVFGNEIPEYVVNTVKTAMAYNQSDRFSSVRKFYNALGLSSRSGSSSGKTDKFIKSFAIKSKSPYYVGDEIELSWSVQNCEYVYLNGKRQFGLRKTKVLKYKDSGKKRLILKAVKGEIEEVRTLNIEVLPKYDNGSYNKDKPVGIGDNIQALKLKDEKRSTVNFIISPIDNNAFRKEQTCIISESAQKKKPVITSFERLGTERIYVGDMVTVQWHVKGADSVTINGEQVPLICKKILKVKQEGRIEITLTAANSAGIVKKSLNLTIYRKPTQVNQLNLRKDSYLQSGKYRIIRVLGQGGFGITYLAENTCFGKLVAIKEFFPKNFCGRDNMCNLTLGTQNNAETVARLKDRFLKEVRNISNLGHPGIISILDIFEENNTAYYVMRYIEGENLNEMVKRNGPLSEAKAVEYISKVGEALEYIHSRKMSHFDVKPANIVLRRSDDQPILIDFGLSKQYDMRGEATSTLMQAVSHGYSPIELYNRGAITTFSPQTDVYSLGATLYYVITGQVPPQPSDIIENGLDLSHIDNPKLKKAIESAMQPVRNKRPASVGEFVRELSPMQKKDDRISSYKTDTQSFNDDSARVLCDNTRSACDDEILKLKSQIREREKWIEENKKKLVKLKKRFFLIIVSIVAFIACLYYDVFDNIQFIDNICFWGIVVLFIFLIWVISEYLECKSILKYIKRDIEKIERKIKRLKVQ